MRNQHMHMFSCVMKLDHHVVLLVEIRTERLIPFVESIAPMRLPDNVLAPAPQCECGTTWSWWFETLIPIFKCSLQFSNISACMFVCTMNLAGPFFDALSSMTAKRLKVGSVGWSNCLFGVADNMANLRSTVQDWMDSKGGDFVCGK